MSYLAAGERGRRAAAVTNTACRLRRVEATRRVQVHPAFTPEGFTVEWIELVGECGHVLDSWPAAQVITGDDRWIGRRKRCQGCPR